MKEFAVVVAADVNSGIGRAGALPWRLSRDMQHFKEVTLQVAAKGRTNAVIMGRKTWESLPVKFRPLPGRVNVVLTSQTDFPLPEGVVRAASLDAALFILSARADIADIFVIGGGALFAEAFRHPLCVKVYLTHILSTFDCDVFIPPVPKEFILSSKSENVEERGVGFFFADYTRPRS